MTNTPQKELFTIPANTPLSLALWDNVEAQIQLRELVIAQIALARKEGAEEMKKKCLEVIPERVTSNGEDDKIYSLVPELKELTFGCVLRDKNAFSDGNDGNEFAQIVWTEIVKSGEYEFKNYAIRYEGTCRAIVMRIEETNFEIIGHEIHLEHIMKVLGGQWACARVTGGYILLKMANNGQYYKYWHGDDNKGTFIIYDDKPFSEQSAEFYSFLWEALNS